MRLVFHPGAPKCATTFIQETVLRNDSGVACIGRPNHLSPGYSDLWRALVYGESKDEVLRSFGEIINSANLSASQARVFVLSDETFFSHVPSHRALAERIYECCSTTDVIITTRDQRTALTSLYQGHGYQLKGVPEPYNGRFVSFESWMRNAKTHHVPLFDYWKAYHGYSAVFGREHTHLLPMELLARSPALYLQKLSGIVGVELRTHSSGRVNPSHTTRKLRYQGIRDRIMRGRSLTRYLPGGVFLRRQLNNYLAGGAPAKPKLTEEQTVWVTEVYGEFNRMLAAATGDSDVAGYPGCGVVPRIATDASKQIWPSANQ